MSFIHKKKKLALIAATSLGVIFFVAYFFKHKAHHALSKQHKPTIVQLSKPKLKHIPVTFSASGEIFAINNTTITALTNGYVTHIYAHPGQIVQKGALLFQLDSQQETNALNSAKINEKLSQLQYERDKNLLKKGFITQDIYHTSEVTMQQNEATLQTAKTNLSLKKITAPFSGTIGSETISPGNFVAPGTKITTLVDNKRLYASYTLPVADLPHISIGQPVIVGAETAPTIKAKATISYISPTINQDTQTITIHATLNGLKHPFKPGQFVQIKQILPHKKKMLLVPSQSIVATASGYRVYTIVKNHAKAISVSPGKQVGTETAIKSGLNKSTPIIIAGQYALHDGTRVSVQKAQGNKS